MSGGSRVSIPKSVQKTIQNIKEIAGNHSDEEVYAMLKECSMDPNETTQKLLFQDTFHEVKRKRDKKKEIVNNREATDSRWRPGTQGRGGRGIRGGYSSRFTSHDAGSGKIPSAGKDDSVNQSLDTSVVSTTLVQQDAKNKGLGQIISSPSGPTNHLAQAKEVTSQEHQSQVVVSDENLTAHVNILESQLPPSTDTKSNVSVVSGTRGQAAVSASQFISPAAPLSVSGVYSSASDPVLVPSLDSRTPGIVGTIKREVGSQRMPAEPNKVMSREVADSNLLSSSGNEKVPLDLGNSFMPGKSGSSSSRPSSNYNSRSQQVVGPQKVGPSKEWKPKSTSQVIAPSQGTVGVSEPAPASLSDYSRPVPATNAAALEETTLKLQKKLEDLHFSDGHVIIPNHLQVPEAERSGLSFGSFDASFGVRTNFGNDHDSDKSSSPLSESSQGIEEAVDEPLPSNQNVSPTPEEEEYTDEPESPKHIQDSLSPSEPDASSGVSPGPECDQNKTETALPSGGPQYSVVHTTPNYSSFGLLPPVLGSQFPTFESSETPTRDTRLPSFVVQQPFDPSTSYYTQFYRPGGDGDGRFSPFLPAPGPAVASKYNGNIAVLSTQTAQSPQQETGNSLVMSTAGPTPLVTQAAGGVMQSSIAVTQQPVPVFRQPTSMHIPHYPPNYIPYSQYFSPFYVPPPAIPHFLSNSAFPQQPPAGNIYPASAAGAATAVKYSLSQYKAGTNTGNSTHIGPTGYGPYTSAPTGYSPSPAVSSGNSAGSEDLPASQYKENNVYMSGQQTEGSAVWIPALGRDISSLQASSYYNLHPQGQHVAFAPTQAGHGAFAGIYHPTQTLAAATVHPLLQQSQTMAGPVEMGPPPAGVYQQPQRAQINWANNY